MAAAAPGSAPDGGTGTRTPSLRLEAVLGLGRPGPATAVLCSTATAEDAPLLALAAGAGVAVVALGSGTPRMLAFLRSDASNRPIAALAWSPDGTHLLAGEVGRSAGGGGGTIHAWHVESGACVQQLRGQHRGGVASLRFSPDGERARCDCTQLAAAQ